MSTAERGWRRKSLFITDKKHYETMGALGYAHVDETHIDRLVKAG